MKRLLYLPAVAMIIGFFYACNTTDKKPAGTGADTARNSAARSDTAGPKPLDDDCVYFVDSTDVEAMKKQFKDQFPETGLTQQFWIETCVLQSIHNFLNVPANANIDGIRFWLGAKKTLLSTKSILMVTSTTQRTGTTPHEQHSNQWGFPIPLGCVPSELVANISYSDAQDKINLFGKKFRRESVEGQRSPAGQDPLSAGIWISRCKFEKLWTLYSGNNLDGVMAICAAYLTDDARRQRGDRKYIVQSTLVFIPTRDGKQLAWDIVQPGTKDPAWAEWKAKGGFNHGQLCPDICD